MEKFFYLLQIADAFNVLTWIIAVISGLLCIFCVVGILSALDDNDIKLCKKSLKPCIIVLSIALLLGIFVPTRKTLILMAGGKIIDQTIQNNPKIKEIPSNTIDLVNEYLKKEIQDLQSEE